MNKNAIEQAKDSDMASSIDAIRRAVKRARQVAAQTGTALNCPAWRTDSPCNGGGSGSLPEADACITAAMQKNMKKHADSKEPDMLAEYDFSGGVR